MSPAKPLSPAINGISWGTIEVEGFLPFRDAKVYPGGAREWDWTETGTHHVPGIQPADIDELLEHGVTVVILSRGQLERLQVGAETLDWLRVQNADVHVLETRAAVKLFNRLRETTPVGGLFHATC